MIKREEDNFDLEEKYKLYRSVKEIINPSISKKNISSYKIIIDENLLPIRVFYPKKVSNLNKVIIYIPGDTTLTKCKSKYSDICSNLSLELDRMIIAVDYYDLENIYPNSLDKIEKEIEYLYIELIANGIRKEDIVLMGDSTGGNYVSSITFRFINRGLDYINKEILLYPLLSGDYDKNSKYQSVLSSYNTNKVLINNIKKYMDKYKNNENNRDIIPLLNNDLTNYPETLIITGDLDPLKDEGLEFYNKLNNNSKYINIEFASHGFINTKDFEIKNKYINGIKEFIEEVF